MTMTHASSDTTRPSLRSAKVAIIMRTKDRLLLLPRALSSVLLQNYADWHLYLVNDGGNRAQLEQALEIYRPVFGSRLTVLHHDISLGMEAASNAALSKTHEEFAVVHDDDDSWDINFLKRTVSFLAAPKNVVYVGVTTDCFRIDETITGDTVRETGRSYWSRDDLIVDYAKLFYRNAFPPISFLFRRSVIDQIGLFNSTMPVLGDWDFNLRIMSVGDIGRVPAPLANYHQRHHGTNSIYSNTSIDGEASHRRQSIILRNEALRIALKKHPELAGLLQAILQPTEEVRHQLNGQIGSHLNGQVHELLHQQRDLTRLMHVALNDLDQVRIVSTWHKRIMLPVYLIWRGLLPIRRKIAKLRGRI